MTDNEKKMILDLWETNNSIENIIKMLPYERKVARRYIQDLRDMDYLTADNRRKWKDVIIQAYKNGMTNPYEIAEEYGYNPTTVRSVLSGAKLLNGRPKHNYKKRKPTDFESLSENTKLIVEDIRNGKSTTEIRKTRHVTRQYIFILKKKFFN